MLKLLITEGDRYLGIWYTWDFTQEGFDVLCVQSGEEAVAALRSFRPDILITEIALPGMDGIQMMREALAMRPDLPVIINSAHPGYMDDFRTWPAMQYVVKPSDLSELKAAVRACLERVLPGHRDMPPLSHIAMPQEQEEFVH